ncbi:hypothetical protein ABEB36_008040 [Hypothenemus hampei]|uniref:Plexin domain-containing protein 2 n=1 Tax=Hypothenemus hampei TaxID=57062 RepID=A0ABD1EMN6_HYPHA
MARFSMSYRCGTVLCLCLWCIFFVLFGFSNALITSIDDRYLYQTDSSHHRSEYSINIDLLDVEDFSNLHKRDVRSPSTRSANKTDDGISSTPIENPTILQSKQNLGENGAGQRKIVTRGKTEVVAEGLDILRTSVRPTSSPRPPEEYDQIEEKLNKLTPESVGDDLDKKDFENNNITDIKSDTHIFYNSTMFNDPKIGMFYWVNLDKENNVQINELLSNSHRRAATVKLSFEFPFYGRYIKNVTVATGGFLYTGNYVHSWLAATQYIAPLMANFDTGMSNSSLVRYADNGTAFTVEWDQVPLQDKPSANFTFQTTLHSNGDIVFVYKEVPLPISEINSQYHPVKVGLSDAYILDRTIYYVRKKTIYEYHRVAFSKNDIKNWTAIYLRALPTCLDLHNCTSCVVNDLNLNCTWCPSLNQCSTGLDRNRQYWLDKGCDSRNITSEANCLVYEEEAEKTPLQLLNETLNYDVDAAPKPGDQDYLGNIPRSESLSTSGYVAIVSLIVMGVGIGIWVIYAFNNPTTTSGQILIRVRDRVRPLMPVLPPGLARNITTTREGLIG